MAQISDGWVSTAEFFSPQKSGVELYILYPTALTGDFWGTAKSQGTLPLPRQPWTCLQEINLRQLRKPPRSLRTVFFVRRKTHIVLLAKFCIFGDKFWLETLRCSNTKTQMKSWNVLELQLQRLEASWWYICSSRMFRPYIPEISIFVIFCTFLQPSTVSFSRPTCSLTPFRSLQDQHPLSKTKKKFKHLSRHQNQTKNTHPPAIEASTSIARIWRFGL